MFLALYSRAGETGMKCLGGVWPRVCSFDNLYLAWCKFLDTVIRPEYTFLWIPVFIGTGWASAKFPSTKSSSQKLAEKPESPFWYSVDKFLPLFQLNEAHKRVKWKSRWARNYFYAHQVAGLILIAFLATALANLATYE